MKNKENPNKTTATDPSGRKKGRKGSAFNEKDGNQQREGNQKRREERSAENNNKPPGLPGEDKEENRSAL